LKKLSTTLRERLNVKTPEEAVPFLNLLVYGEPGAGKTWLAGTALDSPLTSPVLLLDVEGGTVTLRHRKNLDVIQVRTMKEVEQVQNELFKATEPYYSTVIIDSLSELQKLDMRTVQEMEKNRTPDKVDIDIPSMRAWGKNGERMRRLIRAYKDLPIHVIATCLLATDFDEANGVNNYYPMLPGKLRGEVPGYFDVVGYLKAEEQRVDGKVVVTRMLQTTKTRRVVAKDRTSALPDIINNPTIPEMWSLIHDSDSNNGEVVSEVAVEDLAKVTKKAAASK
jgi:phage nucleotide-binding protein